MARGSRTTKKSTNGVAPGAPVAEGNGRIRPRARILRTIGAELISSEVVAVIELVRNCYDADASTVEIAFQDPEDPANATVEIRDNGHGMDRETLLGPWLEPATDHKRANGRNGTGGATSPGGRTRLGSKGVGRFAAQRLGDHLELRTRARKSPTELVAKFDWKTLEAGAYLDQVRVPWREHKAVHLRRHGTHLRISELRNHWTPERFEKLRLGLSRLVSPTVRGDFRITVCINDSKEEVRPAIDAETAMYSIEGRLESSGVASMTYRDINGAEEEWERRVLWPVDVEEKCGRFTFRINAWDLDPEALRHFLKLAGSSLGLRDYRKIVREHSGISLYRDGFRILPYGEPDNDWLRLDRRRVNNPTMRLSNNQILGTIHLTADENPHLRDQTNREGLVTNEAYDHLQHVVLDLMGLLETRRFTARRAMDIDWQRKSTALPPLGDDGLEGQVDALLGRLANGSKADDGTVGELRAALDQYRTATADAVRHYAGLASAGQLSGMVFRQIDHPLKQLKSDLSLVLDDLSGHQPSEDILEDAWESVNRALQRVDTLEKRIHKLDPLAVGGRGRRVSRHSTEEILREVAAAFADDFDRHGVALDFRGNSRTEATTNREVVQHVFAILLDNALWFARQGNQQDPVVTVRATKPGFTVSDTGPGIPESDRHAIFEPHFTTREGAHGLGLTLARDLLKSIGARVRVTDCQLARFSVELG
jgi:hypothetical protein